MSRFWFVHDHRTEYPVKRLCELAECSRSGYYAWRDRPPSQRALIDAELLDEITEIHEASQDTYGAPRVWGQLIHRGRRVGCKRVARLMAAGGLVGCHGRKKWRKGNRSNGAPAPDLLERNFDAEASDLAWMGDVTEFACRDGKLYLAGLVDAHDKGFCGWSMGHRNDTDLAVNALVMALVRRSPVEGQTIHHVDQGSPYTSGEMMNRLTDWGLRPSFLAPACVGTTPRWSPPGRP